MTSLLTDIEPILKPIFVDNLPEMGFDETVTWGMLNKIVDFKGREKWLPMKIGRTPGVSHSFARAQANAGASRYSRWELTRSKSYGVVQFDGEEYEAAESPGAQVDYVVDEVKGAMASMQHRLNRMLFRNHGGAFARLLAAGAGGGTATITVQDPLDLIGIDVGMFIVTSNTDGTSGSVDANPTEIGAIDRIAGTLTTVSGNWNAVAGFSDNDYLFVDGDFGLGVYGLPEWLPASAPASTAFFGVDRTADSLRLGGQRVEALAADGTLSRFFDRAMTEMYLQGARNARTIIMNPRHVSQVRDETNNKTDWQKIPGRTSQGASAEIGYDALKILTDNGSAMLVGDRDCPLHVAYALDMSTCDWHGLKSAGPRILDYGGGQYLRMAAEDSLEGRLGWRGQFAIREPGKCGRFDLSELTDT